jgi:multiple sugar transport system substrate-binding protein
MTSKRWVWAIITMMMLGTLLSATACGTGGGDKTTIKMFFHSGQGAERDALNASIKAFEAQNPDITVQIVNVNENNYNQGVAAAALSGTLPCLLDIDGPNVYNYAWSDYLTPIDKYVTSDLKSDFLSSIINQGTYNNHLYSLGQYDSGLSLYANKSYLEKAGVRIPTYGNPWSKKEFDDALAALKQVSGVQYSMDLMMSYGAGEWFSYSFSPLLQSLGGDLINRNGYQSADGVLNGSDAVNGMTWFQNLFKKGYVNPRPADDSEFPSGKTALAWVGHWNYATYKQALGDNLMLLPAPDLGKGPKTGMGSWNWGITSSCQEPDKTWKVLNFLLSTDQIKNMTDANNAVPARKSAIAKSPLHADNGALHLFVQQLEDSKIATLRPQTAAYPTITLAFQNAVKNIVTGSDVKSELNNAVQKIDQDIKDRNGYQPKS